MKKLVHQLHFIKYGIWNLECLDVYFCREFQRNNCNGGFQWWLELGAKKHMQSMHVHHMKCIHCLKESETCLWGPQ